MVTKDSIAVHVVQLQEVDERGSTLQSSGFHLVRLPFQEERRAPPVPWSWRSVSKMFLSLICNRDGGTNEAPMQASACTREDMGLREDQVLHLSIQAADILKSKP